MSKVPQLVRGIAEMLAKTQVYLLCRKGIFPSVALFITARCVYSGRRAHKASLPSLASVLLWKGCWDGRREADLSPASHVAVCILVLLI